MSRTTTEPKTKSITFKCEEYLITAFKDTCEQNDRTVSQILRDFMREYIQKNRQGELKL